jgi:hypothetical protein
MTTSLQIEEDNVPLVQDLSRSKEFSCIVNELLREYASKRSISYPNKDAEIVRLKGIVQKKEEQYKALQKEIGK